MRAGRHGTAMGLFEEPEGNGAARRGRGRRRSAAKVTRDGPAGKELVHVSVPTLKTGRTQLPNDISSPEGLTPIACGTSNLNAGHVPAASCLGCVI